MKLHLKYLWIVLVACTLTACMNGGGDLAGKWQLRQYQYADSTSEKVDSVFSVSYTHLTLPTTSRV